MFIKLSKIEDHTPFREDWFFTVYINIDRVTEFYRISRFGKSFTNVFTGKECFTVRETPEEIMKLIEEARMLNHASWYGSGTSNLPNTVNGLTIGNNTANTKLNY